MDYLALLALAFIILVGVSLIILSIRDLLETVWKALVRAIERRNDHTGKVAAAAYILAAIAIYLWAYS